VKFPGDIFVVVIWTVKTGLGLRLGLGFLLGLDLGLGLVMTVQFMTVQILTVQVKTGNEKTAALHFLAHVYCRQTAGWIKICHLVWSMDVRVDSHHIVLDGNPAPP